MISSAEEARLRKEAVMWVIRLQGRRPLPEEQQEFDAWRAQSSAHAHMFQRVSDLWDDPALRAAAVYAERAPSSQCAPRVAALCRRALSLGAIAATVVVVVGAVLYVDVPTRLQADHLTAVGERRQIELPDRSRMTLNTQSAVAISFDGAARQIRLLKGEALFDVQPDPARPFVVETSRSATRAVGTTFVVRADSERDRITVLEGRVEVAAGSSGVRTQIGAGSQIDAGAGQVSRVRTVDLSTVSAWMRGRLVVDGVPLSEVLDEVRRYHRGTILLLNSRSRDVQITGTYDLDDPASVLSLLAKTIPLHMLVLSDRLTVFF
ncbi:MAG: FecR domain-containing protein [Nitrospiraceae bacterium]